MKKGFSEEVTTELSLEALLLYSELLKQCLPHSRFSVNICE